MQNKESLVIEQVIKEEPDEYTFQRKGYDFIRVGSEMPKEVVSYKWLFIPLIFLLSFLGFSMYGIYLDEILGREISGRLLAIIGISFFGMLSSMIGFVIWRDHKEDKEEKKYPPRVEFSLFIPLKKPHNYVFKEGDRINFSWEIDKEAKV